MEKQLDQATELLLESKQTIALTGAGISTPSNIPDFRSPKSGLWEKVNPAEIATIQAYKHDPLKVLAFLESLGKKIQEAKPNPAHKALAELERIGRLKAIVTQNIDCLHRKAGSKKVIELHGNNQECACLRCLKVQPIKALEDALSQQAQKTNNRPTCSCGGLLKPNVVFFGESLPQDALNEAFHLAQTSTLCFVVGSSLTVYPASFLPEIVLRNHGKVFILNLQPTPIDKDAILVVSAPVETFLPALLKQIKRSA